MEERSGSSYQYDDSHYLISFMEELKRIRQEDFQHPDALALCEIDTTALWTSGSDETLNADQLHVLYYLSGKHPWSESLNSFAPFVSF